MHIAGITVNASMLTAGIRVHAVHHPHIRAFHFVYNCFGILLYVLRFGIYFFPIIDSFYMLFRYLILYEFILCIELRATAGLILHYLVLCCCTYFMMVLFQII